MQSNPAPALSAEEVAEIAALLVKATTAEHGTPRFTADMGLLNWMHAHGAALLATLSAHAAENARLREALADAIRSWSFDSRQQHTHSWHDREDWIARHPVVQEIRAAALKEAT